jgi:hypothetical protein
LLRFIKILYQKICVLLNRASSSSSQSWLTRSEPFSRKFGFDRGTPVDRRLMDSFFKKNESLIHGSVLEIGDDQWTLKHGRKIERSVVLNGTGVLKNSESYNADLTDKKDLKDLGKFDCVIASNVLNFIYDFDQAVLGLATLINPLTGSLLVTVAGLAPVSRFDYDRWGDYWRFNDMSVSRIFEQYFEHVEVSSHGNAPLAAAFIMGLSQEEVPNHLFDINDQDFQILIAVKASMPKADLLTVRSSGR